MKKIVLTTLIFPLFLCADNLKTLLEYATQTNHLIKAAELNIQASQSELKSIQKSYYPTIDAAAFYQRDDQPTPFYPGTTYGATAKISWDIYDGGKKSFLKKEKKERLLGAKASKKYTQKSLFLSITKSFFNIKTLQASLKAQEEAQTALQAQLKRVKAFYAANLATSDDVNRLQAAFEKQNYTIESLKLKIFSLKKALELEVGREITPLQESHFKKTLTQKAQRLESTELLIHRKNALQNLSKSIESSYYPNIKIEDSYTFFGYAKRPYFSGKPIPLLDEQNKISATLSLRVFDFGTLRQKKEVLKLQAAALQEEISYKSKEQKINITISRKRITTAKLNIESTRSALKAAKETLHTITKKYKAGIVDNVVYLDALATHTAAKALYEKSRNDLEIAYALYYYYNAKNLEEFLQ